MSSLHAALSASFTALSRDPSRHVFGTLAFGVALVAVFLFGAAAWMALAQVSMVWPILSLTVAEEVARHVPTAIAPLAVPLVILCGAVAGMGALVTSMVWSAYAACAGAVTVLFPVRFALWRLPAGRPPLGAVTLALWCLHAATWGASLVVPVVPVVAVGLAFGLVLPLVAADGVPLPAAAARVARSWWRAPGTTFALSLAALVAPVLGMAVPLVGPAVAADFQVRCARGLAA
jgi:hypothetical protein